ncbi:MAG: ADYC domain-containing protein [Nannocystaceae bacterium]
MPQRGLRAAAPADASDPALAPETIEMTYNDATTRSPVYVTLATTLAALSACAFEPSPAIDTFELEFRDDYKTTGEKLNTNFLGEDEDYPLDILPTAPGGVSDVSVDQIHTSHCLDSTDVVIYGSFSTGTTPPHVPLSGDGVLGTLMVADTSDPSVTCRVEGELWEDTYWDITATIEGEIIQTDLWLRDVSVDQHGNTAYEWYVNVLQIDPNAGRPEYRPTCDEDVEGTAIDQTLEYHAYLVGSLDVDGNADFSLVAGEDSMFLACRSGAIGKSIAWGYAPWSFGIDTHELATRMVRADYCGDGMSSTVKGTEIWVRSVLGPDPVPPESPAYVSEAVWDEELERASCVGTPRLGGGPGFTCAAGGSIPACDDDDFDVPDPSSLLFTHALNEAP